MFRSLLPALALMLASCAPAPQVETARLDSRVQGGLPPMTMFGTAAPFPALRSNTQMARDFLDLSFQLESGRALPILTRFESPITVRVTGPVPPTLLPDLDALLARLRHEAGIPITRTSASAANITIQMVRWGELQHVVPQAACFVTPRVSSWSEFRTARNGATADWATLTRREKLAIFIPDDTAPQEMRDCLHEELAQALGPLNDLYRLPDSVFNDDNFNTVLTGFDMLMLRVTYAPELHSGMSEDEVAARLPAIFARLNPAGGRGGVAPPDDTPRAWIGAIETALGANESPPRRRSAAAAALDIATREGWQDNRRGFSLYVLGRLSIGSSPDSALGDFLAADRLYRSRPEYRVQAAHVAMQLAAYALSGGRTQAAVELADAYIPVASQAQNGALLAQLMLMKAAALEAEGLADQAAPVRLQALAWARYGFGDENEVRARAGEIAALVPRTRLASSQ
jgi:hypothetical protein